MNDQNKTPAEPSAPALSVVAGSEFRVGQRVKLSPEGLRTFPPRKSASTGVVTGFSRDGRCINVRRDGSRAKSPYGQSWHTDFRQPDVPNVQSEPRPGDALTKQAKQENTK